MIDCPVPLLQNHREIEELAEMYKELNPRYVLEVGSLYGGTLWFWITNAQPKSIVVSVDKIADNEIHPLEKVMWARRKWDRWADGAGVVLQKIVGNSNDIDIVEIVRERAPFDFIFVDGGHDYITVNNDYEIYRRMLRKGGIMALHDIMAPDKNDYNIEVGKWWREMKPFIEHEYSVTEISREKNKWGIGVLTAK